MATKRQNLRTAALNKIQGPHLTHFVDVTEFRIPQIVMSYIHDRSLFTLSITGITSEHSCKTFVIVRCIMCCWRYVVTAVNIKNIGGYIGGYVDF